MSPRRSIDDVDDLDVLDTYDWNEDPWDASIGVSEVEQVRSQTRVARWIGYTAIAVVTVLILSAGVYGWWYIRQANPAGEPGAVVPFTVVEGDTLASVSERLEDDGIVTSAGFFRSYVNDNGGLEGIEPGLYLLRPRDHVGNILGRLRTSPSETVTRITFPEGYTIAQMARRLAESEDLPQFDEQRFLEAAQDPTIAAALRPSGVTSLEGLLFPATYEISNADSERQVIERMVARMEEIAELEDIGSPAIGAFSPYEILIVASMIEKEAKTERDRPLIARVIYNRLEVGRDLEIDATVLYNVDPATGIDPSDLQPGDIDRLRTVDTPWNTFLHSGLPPTPIANPGRASIEAALHPAPDVTPGDARCEGVPAEQCRLFYYVLADTQGNHSFWVTEAQFAQAVQEARDNNLLGPGG